MKAEADRADQAGMAGTGRNPGAAAARAEADVATRARTKAGVMTTGLMEAVVERGNLMLAYQRVVANKGAAGVDQLTVTELKDHLQRNCPVCPTLATVRHSPCAIKVGAGAVRD